MSQENVRDFYERMPYPGPVASLDKERDLYCKIPSGATRGPSDLASRAATRQTWRSSSRAAAHRRRQGMRFASPGAHITAIDISDASLRHTRDLQRKYKLNNLELHRLPIERVRRARTFVRPRRLHRRAASPARSGPRSSQPSQRPKIRRRDAPDGLCALWARRRLHDAGVLQVAQK